MEYGNFLQTFIKKKEGITWMFLNEERITLIIQILKKNLRIYWCEYLLIDCLLLKFKEFLGIPHSFLFFHKECNYENFYHLHLL